MLVDCDGTLNSCDSLDVQRKMAWFARFSESAQCVLPQMNERRRTHALSKQLFSARPIVHDIPSR